ncbi:MAG TPA: hypothetical protein PK002_00425 [Cellvibrio sp.]|nr:hypothetical protein [Cellvibrio sp.]
MKNVTIKKIASLFAFVSILLSGCTAPNNIKKTGTQHTDIRKTNDKKVTIAVPSNAHKMSSQLISSQKISSNPLVVTFIKKVLADPKNTEPLYGLGYLHMESGIANKNAIELELAEIYLKEVLTQFPGNQAVLRALYNVYYDNILRGRTPNAFDDAKTIFVQIPESVRGELNPPSLAKYAVTLLQQEKNRQPDRQALRDILLAAIQESPQTDNAYIQLANLYSEDRYFPLAIATLKMGTENNQSSADLYKAIADTYIKRSEVNGCNYENPSDIQNSSKYYQLAIPLQPEDQALHTALSNAFFDQNRNQIGLHEAQLAVDIKPTKESISLKAQHLSTLGHHTQAIALLQAAVEKGYSASEAGYHEIFMNQGDWKKAAEGFNAYVINRTKFSVYDLIKSDIIARQAHLQPWPIAKQVVVNSKWEQTLLNYWQARASADDLKKNALTRCEKTEYFFYTGYQDLQAGRSAQAHTKFKAAIVQNTYRFIERPLAAYFLQNN